MVNDASAAAMTSSAPCSSRPAGGGAESAPPRAANREPAAERRYRGARAPVLTATGPPALMIYRSGIVAGPTGASLLVTMACTVAAACGLESTLEPSPESEG